MNDPQIHAALVQLGVIAITALGILLTAAFAWAGAKLNALTKQVERNTPIIDDTASRVSSLENGGTTSRVNDVLAEHGLIERRTDGIERRTDGTANGNGNSTASSQSTA